MATLADAKNVDTITPFRVSPGDGAKSSTALSLIMRPHAEACSTVQHSAPAAAATVQRNESRIGTQQSALAALAASNQNTLRAAPRNSAPRPAAAASAAGAAAERVLSDKERKRVEQSALAAWNDSMQVYPFTFRIQTSLQELKTGRKPFEHRLNMPGVDAGTRIIIHKLDAQADSDSIKPMGVRFLDVDNTQRVSFHDNTLSNPYHLEVSTALQAPAPISSCFEREEVLNPHYVKSYGDYQTADDVYNASVKWSDTLKHFHIAVNSPIGSVMSRPSNQKFGIYKDLIEAEDGTVYIVQKDDTKAREIAARIEKEILHNANFQKTLLPSTILTELVPLSVDRDWVQLPGLKGEAAAAEFERPFTVTIRGEMKVFKVNGATATKQQ